MKYMEIIFLKKQSLMLMCGICNYMHMGVAQVARSFNQEKGTIELNFSNDLLFDIL